MTHSAKRDIHAREFTLNQKRKECNEAILKKLIEYLRTNPGMRFSQALSNLNIVKRTYADDTENHSYNNSYLEDDYYLEPEEVLKRMK